MKHLLISMIRFYQRWISAYTPPTCRFQPSCSHYGVEALQVHGLFRGSWLTSLRILRCHPFHPGGFDPVPPPVHVNTSNPPRNADDG